MVLSFFSLSASPETMNDPHYIPYPGLTDPDYPTAAITYGERERMNDTMLKTIHGIHHIGRVPQAQETAWELAMLAKRMEILNSSREYSDEDTIKQLRYMLADVTLISIGIEEISGCIEDAIG